MPIYCRLKNFDPIQILISQVNNFFELFRTIQIDECQIKAFGFYISFLCR